MCVAVALLPLAERVRVAAAVKARPFAVSPLPDYTRAHVHMGLRDLEHFIVQQPVVEGQERPVVLPVLKPSELAFVLDVPEAANRRTPDQQDQFASDMRLQEIARGDSVLAAILAPGRLAAWRRRNEVADRARRAQFTSLRSDGRDGTARRLACAAGAVQSPD